VKARAITILFAVISMTMMSGCFEKVPLSVTNGLENYDIHVVYISRSTDSVWGTNHLPGTDILEPGRTAEVMVTTGVYDIQVIDEDGDTYTLNDVKIDGDGFTWNVTIDQIDTVQTPAPGNTGSTGTCPVTFSNDLGSWDITGVYISPSDSDSWGDNHIQGEILYPGDTYTAYVESDTYDIYLEDEDGDTYTRWSVYIGDSGYHWDVSLSDLDSSGG